MITHDEARMLASARADGELEPARAPEPDEHLGSCAECRAFSAALPRLSALAAALPREHAPADLAQRVATRMPRRSARSRRATWPRWRLTPAIAAAVAVSLVIVLAGQATVVPVPRAAAAEALARLRTLYVERQIRDFDGDGIVAATTLERIWFRAPDLVRTERAITDDRGTTQELVIERSGVRYVQGDTYRQRQTGIAPTTRLLPEPLSPTIALIGSDLGPGTVVAGRATRRYKVMFDSETLLVSVDAQTFSALGTEESTVVGKGTFTSGLLVRDKKVLAIHYNQPIPDSLFRIPTAMALDFGFRPRAVDELPLPPAGTPKGFTIVSSGAGPGGAAVLYARGAMPVLVTIDGSTAVADPSVTLPTHVGRHLGELVVGLYNLPTVRFEVAGFKVAVSAPLNEAQLTELAANLYPITKR